MGPVILYEEKDSNSDFTFEDEIAEKLVEQYYTNFQKH